MEWVFLTPSLSLCLQRSYPKRYKRSHHEELWERSRTLNKLWLMKNYKSESRMLLLKPKSAGLPAACFSWRPAKVIFLLFSVLVSNVLVYSLKILQCWSIRPRTAKRHICTNRHQDEKLTMKTCYCEQRRSWRVTWRVLQELQNTR